MKYISILGSTGSIGTQTLKVCENINISIYALAANTNIKLLEKQARKYKPSVVCIYDKNKYKLLKDNLFDTSISVLSEMEGLIEISKSNNYSMLVNAIVGMIGIEPTLEGIKSKKNIAIANKESLVTAGDIINEYSKKYNTKIFPIDSEHSAILQCLRGNKLSQVNKIILTASGGPFRGYTYDMLKNVTLNETLKHPNWIMGKKISVDSATLMNKGLEFIEAIRLFDIDSSKIEIIIHPQSIIHSMVEYDDRSIIAQLGLPDMKIPIQYALTYPDRIIRDDISLNFDNFLNLTFEKPDIETFICLKACIKAIEKGGLYPTIVNGANEQAVDLYLKNKISFLDIGKIVYKSLDININRNQVDLKNILYADKISREFVLSNI
ncbi:MAG: 1-deoxy-D-xylulose-5-phosphate reductoisomerase [Oscillospiraceae bacterium]|nr:1-deoxy-D-xylulose-5-phosphate reductoisomerase [Oscillospiraceae bacterium]